VCFLLDPTVPYDALESLNWANNGEFGSPKNPYMVGGVTAFGLLMEPLIPISLYWYLSHFVGVGIGMLGVWLLGKRLFGDNQIALLSLLSLNISGIINFDIIPYNDNYLLVTLWPYIFLCFIKAVYDHQKYWFALAIVSGLAAMSKYSSCVFLPFMFAYTLVVPEARKAYRTPVIYMAVLLLILIALPNMVWLYRHDFAAINWFESQITFGLNLKLLGILFAVFYPVILLALILKRLGGRWVLPVTPERRAFLWLTLPPIIFVLGYLLMHVGGNATEWLQPFVVLAPIALYSVINFESVKSLRVVNLALMGVAMIVWLGYLLVMLLDVGGAGTRSNSIQKISADLNSLWEEKYHQPLRYVGGSQFSHWLTFYAPDRPVIVTPWSDLDKPNIYNAKILASDVQKDGALFVRESVVGTDEITFEKDLADFPGMVLNERHEFSFSDGRGQTVRLSLGFVAPRK